MAKIQKIHAGLYINILAFLLVFVLPGNSANSLSVLPDGFTYIKEYIPDIKIELRYYTSNNFIGERIRGYNKPAGILTKKAAISLAKVQSELEDFGLGLKIYDAYRPQTAVNHFVEWAKNLSDIRMKPEFYPGVAKENLFKEGYISERSSHSRGSTVDLTVISLETGAELDMGSSYDFFGTESWPTYPDITQQQRSNRLLLQSLMTKYGFLPYPREWWHFTLENEPYPDTYFDFPVE